MSVRAATTESAANTEVTLTITLPAARSRIFLRSLTISTRGADLPNDVEIDVKDNAVEIWSMNLRALQVYGAHINFPEDAPVIARAGDMTIVAGAAGALCLVKISCTYELR